MGRIIQLDSKLQNMIAAGEVIESIANVVKELVENALDAGATRIDIALEEAGMKRILVVDNGSGMDEEDAKKAFLRHATSKIRTEYDLFHIDSLGFRGEALPSIAAISRVELITSQGDEAGIKIIVQDNEVVKTETAPPRKGTSVSVTRLFYHTPARFKYLKPMPKELQQTVELVSKLALAYPEVSLTLANNDKLIVQTPGNGNLLDVIAIIYGIESAKRMVRFQAKNRDYMIEGYMSEPTETRSSRKHISVFVNRRPIRDFLLANTVTEAYGQLIPLKRFPLVVLMIKVDPQLIDVNVHPTKLEVKFSEVDTLRSLVYSSIRNTLAKRPVMETINSMNRLNEPSTSEISATLVREELEQLSLFAGSGTYKPGDDLNMDYIGQYRGTYLLFQNDEGLFLMDQHAAAERIRYERYLDQLKAPKTLGYQLLMPLKLEVSPDILTRIDDQEIERLALLGVRIMQIANSLELLEVPHWFPRGHELEFAETMLENLLTNKSADAMTLRDELAKLLSCKHSLKANAFVNAENANALLRGLMAANNPYTCPHGRPIFVKLTNNEIEKLFKRIGS